MYYKSSDDNNNNMVMVSNKFGCPYWPDSLRLTDPPLGRVQVASMQVLKHKVSRRLSLWPGANWDITLIREEVKLILSLPGIPQVFASLYWHATRVIRDQIGCFQLLHSLIGSIIFVIDRFGEMLQPLKLIADCNKKGHFPTGQSSRYDAV